MDYFDLSPDKFAWRGSRPHEIETRRADMSDQLIFDVLLVRGGIREPDSLWPPHDPTGLRRLLDAIQTSSYDALKNDCLVYFLLKWHQDGREAQFAQELAIPPQFVSITDAYWHLDSGVDAARAIGLLSDARVHREYSSKVIQALSLAPNPSPLIVRFVRTVKPALTEPGDIDAYLLALAETSFLEAWLYQRSFPDDDKMRGRLLQKIVEWCFVRTSCCMTTSNVTLIDNDSRTA
ncbi:nuclear pore complex assembly-domain-containing protein [Vararia minispora EC-137]|uniref:Nuclear pore complex assembly-domain-containing protein n=1 Tax=Vararia minispora EC-137 TaxID=1314806 RepID=A0ACB8QND3_9AGAM|nr:nuclear pore complex assembly-domain-containing protein [Vararia minispora EC-137]